MSFKYKWSDREKGNYAIRRKDTNTKPAGKEIEPKQKQTSETHFFLFIDTNDENNMYDFYANINPILKTIKYEYVYKETGNNALTRYLTKEDIDDVLQNIQEYRNKTITIKIPIPFSKYDKAQKQKKEHNKKYKKLLTDSIGYQNYEKILNLLNISISKQEEVKKKQREIKKLKKDLLILEQTTNTEKEQLEKNVFNILKTKFKDLTYTGGVFPYDFQELLRSLYDTTKTEKQRIAGNKAQARYRENKNAKSGKPKQKQGRPKKNRT